MTIPNTIVTFPRGDTEGQAKVLLCQPLESDPNKTLILVDKTPFHPVDYNWPDQPADRGYLIVNDTQYPVTQCVTVAYNENKNLYVDQEIKAHKNNINLVFCVGHIIDTPLSLAPADTIELHVDKDYRHALSSGHTLCHLASLALNKGLANYWRKEITKDSLGHPDFDRLAIVESKIIERGSIDKYRMGKSLRKKGFNSANMLENISDVEKKLNQQVHDWLTLNPTMKILPEEGFLKEKRVWYCKLPDGTAEIPCGGTHLDSMQDMNFHITLEAAEESPEMTMTTKIL